MVSDQQSRFDMSGFSVTRLSGHVARSIYA
jgi:hypothetical protein